MIPQDFLIALAPELTLCGLALVLLLGGAYVPMQRQRLIGRVVGLAIIGLIGVGLLLWDTLLTMTDPSVYMEMYRRDAFTTFIQLVIVIAATLALMLANRWTVTGDYASFEYTVLLLFSTLGLMLLVGADNFLSLYVALEFATLSMYVMAAYERDELKSSEAGLKYFILGSLASGMLLFGISLIYGFSGAIAFGGVADATVAEGAVNIGVIVGLVLVLVAVCFKISAVPFHMWTPDVYEGAPTPVVAFFATAPKVAVLAILIRLLNQVFTDVLPYWQQVIVFVSIASMVVGALAGLVQHNIKRLIAYSSIGHIGYVLLGVAAGTESATESVLIYLVIYTLTSFGLFACLLLLRRNGVEAKSIHDLTGLSSSHPKMALALAVLMFSLAGIPPFAGFFGKFFVFAEAVAAGLTGMVIVAVLTSVVACYYYIRLVKLMYFDTLKTKLDAIARPGLRGYVLMFSLAIHLFVLMPAFLTEPVKAAARAVFP